MLLAFPAIVSAQHTGKVFVDANHNGRWDKGETLMKGISVSDGLNVVLTDEKGCFRLPGHEKERFIFITTPSGYKTENAYYHRIEEGQTSYDFGLLRYDAVKSDGSHSLSIYRIPRSVRNKGKTNGRKECANMPPMKRWLLLSTRAIFVM